MSVRAQVQTSKAGNKERVAWFGLLRQIMSWALLTTGKHLQAYVLHTTTNYDQRTYGERLTGDECFHILICLPKKNKIRSMSRRSLKLLINQHYLMRRGCSGTLHELSNVKTKSVNQALHAHLTH
jgi:hypothetical protein